LEITFLARFHLKLGNFSESKKTYTRLVDQNAESSVAINGLINAMLEGDSINDSNIPQVLDILTNLSKTYPRAHACSLLALSYSDGEIFETLIHAYLMKGFRKGVSSLFNTLQIVLKLPKKRDVIFKVVTSYSASLTSCGMFIPDNTCITSSKEAPSVYIWVNAFLAQMYDSQKMYSKALDAINVAIEHSPTVVELLMTKARIYKHAGDQNLAMDTLNNARLLDLQDRFINSKCTKYMIQNDQLKIADDTISLFTRSQAFDPLNDLIEMQCLWYTTAVGKSYQRQGIFGPALKRFHQVDKHFMDFYDDQFDFHAYALRKCTLRAYFDMLGSLEHVKSHQFYVKAAKSAIEIYIELFDNPKINGVMTDADKKKSQRKARKADSKSKEAAVLVAVKEGPGNNSQNNQKKKIDDDPFGKKYLENPDYLSEAVKFLKPIQALNPQDVEVWILGCKVYLRKKKLLLVLKCLKAALKIAPMDYSIHFHLAEFCLALSNNDLVPSDITVRKLLFEGAGQLLGQFGLDQIKEWNNSWLSMSDASCRLSGAKVLVLTDSNEVCNSITAISSLVSDLDWQVLYNFILDGH
jgi:peptide alpha-N-acetyltransferase